MYTTHYKISDFCISNQPIPKDIADKILIYHLMPLNIVQDETPFDVRPSANSGYRPYVWEIARGRSGRSQHTFGEREGQNIENEKGATDITCEDFKANKQVLLDALIKHTNYIRFAVYETFIHADYKDTNNGKRLLFDSDSNSNWKFKQFIN